MLLRPMAVLLGVLLLTACSTGGAYRAATTHLPGLNVSLADVTWNGRSIPKSGVCSNDGGGDLGPALVVRDIPAGANAIIVQFNDLDHPALDSNGGLGSIGLWLENHHEAFFPPVKGYSVSMPDRVFIERNALTRGRMASQGYVAPCSGGTGHRYTAEVLAVRKATGPGETNQVLARQPLMLGRY